MKAKQEDIVKQREKNLAQKEAEKEREKQKLLQAKLEEKNLQKRQIQALSFADEEEEDDDGGDISEEDVKPTVPKKIKKNPDVDTSFLPDRYDFCNVCKVKSWVEDLRFKSFIVGIISMDSSTGLNHL